MFSYFIDHFHYTLLFRHTKRLLLFFDVKVRLFYNANTIQLFNVYNAQIENERNDLKLKFFSQVEF